MMSLKEARGRAVKLTDAMYYQNGPDNIVIIKIQKSVRVICKNHNFLPYLHIVELTHLV